MTTRDKNESGVAFFAFDRCVAFKCAKVCNNTRQVSGRQGKSFSLPIIQCDEKFPGLFLESPGDEANIPQLETGSVLPYINSNPCYSINGMLSLTTNSGVSTTGSLYKNNRN